MDPTFTSPRTVTEALEAVSEPGSLFVAGGTSLGILMRQRMIEPSKLVWLGKVSDLGRISPVSDGLRLGAQATLAEIARSQVVRERQPMLARAASVVANPRVRSVATVGGGLVHADPRQDLLPALLAAGARVFVEGSGGKRQIDIGDGFFKGFLETEVADDELITHLVIPDRGGARQRYRRFTPQSQDDYPTVSVAAKVTVEGNEVTSATLALGGVASTPILVEGVSAVFRETRTLEQAIADTAALARSRTSPTSDDRGSAEYKSAMAEVMVRQVLQELILSNGGPDVNESHGGVDER